MELQCSNSTKYWQIYSVYTMDTSVRLVVFNPNLITLDRRGR